MIGLDRLISRQLRVRAGPYLDLVTVGKIDRGIENHLVAVLDASTYLDGRTEVAHHSCRPRPNSLTRAAPVIPLRTHAMGEVGKARRAFVERND